MIEWQPIETAPKDGTPVLVWSEHDEPSAVVARWEWTWDMWEYVDTMLADVSPEGPPAPSHWSPINAPEN
ncbi:MAG: hypothetical protein VYB54_04855 [Pseudomonadota bacterium]|nr:hypothetical protein [Pseudomonadota bacterium]